MDWRLQTEPAVAALDATVSVHHAAVGARPRLDSIDLLRGLVMVVMVLDHARDYLSGSGTNPRDVTDAALFMTRWITHFCAPVFILLAGISVYLYGQRGRSKAEVAHFAVTRGLWLVLIELTVVRFAWMFHLDYDFVFLQVIWVIGWSLCLLGALIYLPRVALLALSLGVIAGHHLLDGIEPASFGSLSWLWVLLHGEGLLHPQPGATVLALYALVPWFAVMSLGYALGPVFLQPDAQRKRTLLRMGAATIVLFVVLRASNLYGDPAAWSTQGALLATVLSFINCEKYPPSLLYLAMTLGPAFLMLAWTGRARSRLSKAVITVGRVPFFFYVAHIFVVHLMGVLVAWAMGIDIGWLFAGMPPAMKPAGYGVSLAGVYVLWIIALLLLYPFCEWFARLKQRRTDWWLSYL